MRLIAMAVVLAACAALTACSMTAAETADDVDPPASSAVSTAPPPEAALVMTTVQRVCPNITPTQTQEVQSGVQNLIAVNGADVVRQDDALVQNNVQQFVDNVQQICGAQLSVDQRRDLVAQLNRLIAG